MFAVPIGKMGALIPLLKGIAYTIPPCAPAYVLGVVKPYGQFITVIDLLNIYGFSTVEQSANLIVVLNHFNKMIGIPAQNAHLVSALDEELTDDQFTGTKVLLREGIEYFILDVPRLYEYIGA